MSRLNPGLLTLCKQSAASWASNSPSQSSTPHARPPTPESEDANGGANDVAADSSPGADLSDQSPAAAGKPIPLPAAGLGVVKAAAVSKAGGLRPQLLFIARPHKWQPEASRMAVDDDDAAASTPADEVESTAVSEAPADDPARPSPAAYWCPLPDSNSCRQRSRSVSVAQE